jgi:hypothetical protein
MEEMKTAENVRFIFAVHFEFRREYKKLCVHEEVSK